MLPRPRAIDRQPSASSDAGRLAQQQICNADSVRSCSVRLSARIRVHSKHVTVVVAVQSHPGDASTIPWHADNHVPCASCSLPCHRPCNCTVHLVWPLDVHSMAPKTPITVVPIDPSLKAWEQKVPLHNRCGDAVSRTAPILAIGHCQTDLSHITGLHIAWVSVFKAAS